MTTNDSEAAIQVLQPHHFLKIHDGNLIFWDYKNHHQFQITPQHLARLVEFSKGDIPGATQVDSEIAESGVLVDREPNEAWGWDWLAHIFHYGTCHASPLEAPESAESSLEYARSYLDFCSSLLDSEPDVEMIKGGRLVEIPVPNMKALEQASLWDVLRRRRTCRDFDGGPVSLQTISNLLYCAFGDQKSPDPTAPPGIQPYGYRRTSPSAGGLQCTEPYLWDMNVDGLTPGIYHYLSCRHQLEVVRESLPDHSLGAYMCNQVWANDMAFAVIMTARFDKMWWKYPHSRAYRPMLMDIGHISQTLNLGIAASGLHPWITGYFHDIELIEILKCAPGIEHPILVVGGGTGSGSSYSRETRAFAESAGSA